MHRAIIKLVGLARRNRAPLRQSYPRLAKRAAIMVGRYTHAHQFKRGRRELKFLRTRLGRIIRDIRRRIDSDAVLEARFGRSAQQVPSQDQHQRGPKVYALHPRSSASARVNADAGCKTGPAHLDEVLREVVSETPAPFAEHAMKVTERVQKYKEWDIPYNGAHLMERILHERYGDPIENLIQFQLDWLATPPISICSKPYQSAN